MLSPLSGNCVAIAGETSKDERKERSNDEHDDDVFDFVGSNLDFPSFEATFICVYLEGCRRVVYEALDSVASGSVLDCERCR